ncbi:MAG: M17 family peptidase N-terminal domain-containing protein, partial [Candidatus Berkiella sp.]
MDFSVKTTHPEKHRCDCLIVAVSEPRRLSAAGERINQASKGYLSQLLKRGDIEGKFGQFLMLQNIPGISAERVLLVGQGNSTISDFNFRDLMSRTAVYMNNTAIKEAVSYLNVIEVTEKDLSWKLQQTLFLFQASH